MAKEKQQPKRKTAGRPPKNDPDGVDEIQNKIDLYFESLERKVGDDIVRDDPTFSGLALALGYTSRQSLWENSKSNKPISLPLKRAMLRIEESYEKGLRLQTCTGAIFALKNRGWADKSEIEHSGSVTIIDDVK
jgi:hypothetical protein